MRNRGLQALSLLLVVTGASAVWAQAPRVECVLAGSPAGSPDLSFGMTGFQMYSSPDHRQPDMPSETGGSTHSVVIDTTLGENYMALFQAQLAGTGMIACAIPVPVVPALVITIQGVTIAGIDFAEGTSNIDNTRGKAPFGSVTLSYENSSVSPAAPTLQPNQ